ncbi:hypothetical protein B0H11DRAFT_2291084 [Mycena galericulata]|nr:hypothetical protein B0H11DRAFT_2291084 [Mycena galericulata]
MPAHSISQAAAFHLAACVRTLLWEVDEDCEYDSRYFAGEHCCSSGLGGTGALDEHAEDILRGSDARHSRPGLARVSGTAALIGSHRTSTRTLGVSPIALQIQSRLSATSTIPSAEPGAETTPHARDKARPASSSLDYFDAGTRSTTRVPDRNPQSDLHHPRKPLRHPRTPAPHQPLGVEGEEIEPDRGFPS